MFGSTNNYHQCNSCCQKYRNIIFLLLTTLVVLFLYKNVETYFWQSNISSEVEPQPCLIHHESTPSIQTRFPNNRDNNKLDGSTFGRIFTNYTLYSAKIKPYIDISNKMYPKSWQELNNQLFCPIKYSSSLSLNKASINQESILKHIFQTQFLNNDESKCLDPNRKCLSFIILIVVHAHILTRVYG